jgi:hypothetical protein
MKSLIGIVLAAVVMFFWGFLFWTVSPLPKRIMKTAPDEMALAQGLGAQLKDSGVYILPGMREREPESEYASRVKAGPLAWVIFRREGTEPLGATTFAAGFLHMLASVAIMAWLLGLAGPDTYAGRLGLTLVAGLAGSVFSNLGKPIWWIQPWDFHILNFAYDITSWALAALVLAHFVRRRS